MDLDSALFKRISKMYSRDMFYRNASDSYLITNSKLQDSLDKLNQQELVLIIDSFGYPGKSIVGASMMNKAFLVIQHSNLIYQEKYLPILIEAANKGELNWQSVALLLDRIEMLNGRLQIYGSQVCIDSIGKYYVYPIIDKNNVNKRRIEVGLDSIDKYLKLYNIQYDPN